MHGGQTFVGLDIHSKVVQACVTEPSGKTVLNRRCPAQVGAIVEAVGREGPSVEVAIEACCGAAELAEQLAAAAGWTVRLAHPGYVSRMRRGPDKSDYCDARLLAELCRTGFLPTVWLAPSNVRELRKMVRYRAEQVRQRAAVKTRTLAVLRERRIAEPKLGRWSLGWMAWLREQAPLSESGRWVVDEYLRELDWIDRRVKRAERRLAQMTAKDPVVRRLRELPGVGPVTAWTMRAFIGRFDRFADGKQLARYCGVTPRNASSGQRMADAGLVKAGDPLLKTALIQLAHRIRKRVPRWQKLAAEMESRGKPACVVVAALANRWVRWAYHRMTEPEGSAMT